MWAKFGMLPAQRCNPIIIYYLEFGDTNFNESMVMGTFGRDISIFLLDAYWEIASILLIEDDGEG